MPGIENWPCQANGRQIVAHSHQLQVPLSHDLLETGSLVIPSPDSRAIILLRAIPHKQTKSEILQKSTNQEPYSTKGKLRCILKNVVTCFHIAMWKLESALSPPLFQSRPKLPKDPFLQLASASLPLVP